MAIDPAHRLGPQVQTQIDGDDKLAALQGADQRAEAILVARFAFGAVVVVVMEIDGLQMAGGLVFLANRVVEVHRDHLGYADSFGLGHHPSNLIGAQHRPDVVGLPGADAETVSHIGRVGCLDKLALQGG